MKQSEGAYVDVAASVGSRQVASSGCARESR